MILPVGERQHADSTGESGEAEQLYRTLGDVAPGFVWVTDSEGRLIYANRRWEEYTGSSLAELNPAGWEQFHQPVDRIVSIGAFEHFHASRYDDFFTFAHDALPRGGVMLLHTITISDAQAGPVKQLPVTMTLLRFIKFIMTEIFPGGQLPGIATVIKHARKAGFCVGQVQSLQPHYAKTLDMWAAALQAHKDEAIASQSDQIYQRYVKYLTGCAELFRNGYTDVCQFTLEKR